MGRIGALECDFILRDDDMNYAYVQVAYTIAERQTEEREYASLERISDGYPKHLLCARSHRSARVSCMHTLRTSFLGKGIS